MCVSNDELPTWGTMNAIATAARPQAATPAGSRSDQRLSSSATISAAGST